MLSSAVSSSFARSEQRWHQPFGSVCCSCALSHLHALPCPMECCRLLQRHLQGQSILRKHILPLQTTPIPCTRCPILLSQITACTQRTAICSFCAIPRMRHAHLPLPDRLLCQPAFASQEVHVLQCALHRPSWPSPCPLQCQDNVVTKGDLKSFSFDQLVKFNLQKCSSDSDCECVHILTVHTGNCTGTTWAAVLNGSAGAKGPPICGW